MLGSSLTLSFVLIMLPFPYPFFLYLYVRMREVSLYQIKFLKKATALISSLTAITSNF